MNIMWHARMDGQISCAYITVFTRKKWGLASWLLFTDLEARGIINWTTGWSQTSISREALTVESEHSHTMCLIFLKMRHGVLKVANIKMIWNVMLLLFDREFVISWRMWIPSSSGQKEPLLHNPKHCDLNIHHTEIKSSDACHWTLMEMFQVSFY